MKAIRLMIITFMIFVIPPAASMAADMWSETSVPDHSISKTALRETDAFRWVQKAPTANLWSETPDLGKENSNLRKLSAETVCVSGQMTPGMYAETPDFVDLAERLQPANDLERIAGPLDDTAICMAF